MSEHHATYLTGAALAASAVICFFAPAAAMAENALRNAPAQWLDRLAPDDRAPLESWINYLPPRFDETLHWVPSPISENGEEQNASWSALKGKVVVVQSWTIADRESSQLLSRVAKVVEEFSEFDVQLIALHTPLEAEKAKELVTSVAAPHVVAIDRAGDFCDLLGMYRTPVNMVIARNGAVRYAGLTPDGLREAIHDLLDEDPWAAPCAGSRPILPSDSATAIGDVRFPPTTGGQPRANDLRGQRAPEFYVETWLANEPASVGHNVTVVEFFGSGCPHCITQIPHMNSLAEQFGDKVTIIALSNEQRARFEQGIANRGLSLDSFKHPVALDTTNRFRNVISPQGIPNAVVLCSDWIVRWQGHPARLTAPILDMIVRADEANIGSAPVRRWKAERETGRPVLAQRASARGSAGADGFPPITGDAGGATDFRGKTGPDFHVTTWITDQPPMGRKVTVIEFWRTGCPHCIRAIPKKNEWADHFGDAINIIAISNEQPSAFEQGMTARQISRDSFRYYVALDPLRRMQNAVAPRGVPYAMVLDSAWTVRWQGHPNNLSIELLEQIVSADEAQGGASARGAEARTPADRGASTASRGGAAGFPPITGDLSPAVDYRGKTGPDFHVSTWLTPEPRNLGHNVTLIEFFAVWCPHCRNAIPKMNEFQEHFGNRLNVIAISDENQQTFDQNLARNNLSLDAWKHPVALDWTNTMKNAVRPRGVPYAMVLGSDWTVRWQGHPANLSIELLDQIIRADEAIRPAGPRRP